LIETTSARTPFATFRLWLDEVARRFPPSEYAMFVAIGYTKMNKIREGNTAQPRS
jgi:hypothetical protein